MTKHIIDNSSIEVLRKTTRNRDPKKALIFVVLLARFIVGFCEAERRFENVTEFSTISSTTRFYRSFYIILYLALLINNNKFEKRLNNGARIIQQFAKTEDLACDEHGRCGRYSIAVGRRLLSFRRNAFTLTRNSRISAIS